MQPNILLTYNPEAGKRRAAQMLEPIVTGLSRAGALVAAVPVDAAPTRDLLDTGRFDALVCCGGDGTLHYAVNDALLCAKRVPVGYFPSGSTNDFAATMGLTGRSLDEACAAIAALRTRQIDVGLADGRAFCYIAAFGMFTDVSYQTPQEAKNALGHFAYIAEGVRRLNLEQGWRVRVRTDAEEFEDEFWYGSVTNTTHIGGMALPEAMNVVLDDGLFEMVLIRRPQNVLELQRLVTCLMTQKPDGDLLRVSRVRRAEFLFEGETPWTLDGEEGPAEHGVRIEVLGRGLDLLM